MTEPDNPTVTTVTSHLDALVAESKALRTDLRAKEAARRREIRTLIGVMTILAVFMLLVLTIAWQNNQVVKQTHENGEKIADCTTAGGKCYEDGKARTGAAIADILRGEIALGECSRLYPGESGPAFDVKLRACVYQRIQTDPSALPSPTG